MAENVGNGSDLIRKAALDLLRKGMAQADSEVIDKFLSDLELKQMNAAEADKIVERLTSAMKQYTEKGTNGFFDVVGQIMQSPPFYFLTGCILLAFSFIANHYSMNSSLTFLVAMLGVAILLYGTGSQAAGTFGADTAAAQRLLSKPPNDGQAAAPGANPPVDTAPNQQVGLVPAAANVAIAGGAAVLTAFFGWGVIMKSEDIRQVFRDYDQYVQVRVELCDVAAQGCTSATNDDSVIAEGPSQQSGINPSVMQDLRQNIYLVTGLGHRAFVRENEGNLEFIVFMRDLGKTKQLKLVGSKDNYSISDEYFSIDGNDRCKISGGGNACVVVATVDARDIENIPTVVLRAAVRATPVQTVTTNSNSSITAVVPIAPI